MPEQKYVALTKLLIPCPGQVPSTLRCVPGDIFSLDGNEGIHVDRLLRQHAIALYEGPQAALSVEEPSKVAPEDS